MWILGLFQELVSALFCTNKLPSNYGCSLYLRLSSDLSSVQLYACICACLLKRISISRYTGRANYDLSFLDDNQDYGNTWEDSNESEDEDGDEDGDDYLHEYEGVSSRGRGHGVHGNGAGLGTNGVRTTTSPCHKFSTALRKCLGFNRFLFSSALIASYGTIRVLQFVCV